MFIASKAKTLICMVKVGLLFGLCLKGMEAN
jgi:hypothetical protein